MNGYIHSQLESRGVRLTIRLVDNISYNTRYIDDIVFAMTDGSVTQNPPDNRLWAVLFLAVSILIAASLPYLAGESKERPVRQNMVLHDSGSKLEWLPEQEIARDAGPAAVRAELSPFFFAPVPVNTAGREVLTTLPGIGPGMADRIIDFRTSNGPITSAEMFMRVPGIGSKRLESLRPFISFQ